MTQTTIKEFSVRVAMMLLVMMLTTVTAWAADVTLSGSENYTAQDGDVLTGSTSGTVTIASGANVTLSDVTITGGIVCSSSATITLVGTNSTTGGYGKAGIQIGGSGTTLTINGDGTLTANGGTDAAGIGLNCAWNVTEDVVGGNIVINGGNITANGGGGGAGIGAGVTKDKNNSSSRKAIVGNITITGGTVTAVGGSNADGIGAGENNYDATIQIGTVTIYDAIEMVDASSIKDFANVVYMHGETNVTASKTDYFTIIEDGDRRIIEKKDNTDYTITIADNSENGTIACAAATAKYGEKITITATPDFGYRLSRLVVKDAQNNNVASTGNSFFMPKSNVTVSAVFEQGVHGTTEFAWGYFGIDGFVNEATIYDGVTTVNIQNTKVSYNILKYEEYTYPKFQLDNDTYYADIPYAGGTGEFYGTGNGTYFSIPYDGETGYYDITMTDVGNGKWGVSILPTVAQMDVVPDQTYTGSAITPEPLVMAGSLNLTKGTDYVYSYTNNTNAGTAKVRATFQGDYASLGYVEKEFTIVFDPSDWADNGDGSYTIGSTLGWEVFCDALQDNDTYNRFSGKTVKLGGDIGTAQNPITRMAGSDHLDFCGTFDGQDHTLTVDISSDSRRYTAPFAYVSETTPTGGSEVSHPAIRNLNVTGTVNATKEYASGLVGAFWGTLTIENCTSSVTVNTSNKYAAGFISNAQGNAIIRNCLSSATINSTVSGDGTHAGFIGVAGSVNLNIEGCAFTGSLLGTSTTSCAGFVGYGGTVTITNSLYAPAEVTVQNDNSATFARGNTPSTTNSYYSAALGAAQGKAVRTVTAGTDVILYSPGPLDNTNTYYNVSGIRAYTTGGLYYNHNLYYGSGDRLSILLGNTRDDEPLGYRYTYAFSGGTADEYEYSADDGETSYHLTMPDEDVTISVNTAALAPIDWATVNQGNSTDPYMIYNKDQLNLLAYRVNGTHGETAKSDGYSDTYFKLGADIKFDHAENETDDYAENYEAIGSYHNDTNHYFNGIFDGDGYTVSGIRINKTDGYYSDYNQGLFGSIYLGANIHDVHLTDARITGRLYVGGIAGSVDGGTVTGCVVTDSYITVSDYYNNPSDDYGTICGGNYGTLTNNYYHGCTVNGTENATNVGCGGIYDGGDYTVADVTDDNGALPAYAITLGANITTPPGTFVGQTEWLDTPPASARLAPENGFTLAGNHYFASGYEFTPGSTLASGAAQGYTPRATLGGQLLDPYTPTGDADPLAGKAIARLTITADCDGKTLASTQAIYSTRQSVTVAYIKADGTPGEASAIALDGTETSLAAGTYFVGLPEVNFTHTLDLEGNVTLILKDGCAMNVGTDAEKISATGIDGSDYAIDIYAQSLGNDKGTLAIYTKGTNHRGISVGDVNVNGGNVNVNNGAHGIFAYGDITVNGGSVTANSTGTSYDAIETPKGDITINGGTVNATGTRNGIYAAGSIAISGGNVKASGGNNWYGISANVSVAICGGIVEATGGASAISANNGITLGWTNYSDRIYANSYRGIVSVKAGQAFVTDEATPAVIGGTISDLAAINGKTLKPATFYLVGNMTNPEWTVNADYQLTVNPGNTSELMIQNVPLTGSTEFKVVYSANGTESTTWYPGDGYNYWISADGIYDIYFRPDYQGGDDWHYGCIYATDVSNIEVAFAPEGFATYYHGTFDVKLPEGVKARIVTARGDSEGTLTYETIADGDTNDKVVPAGTAVMLQTEKSTEAQQKTLTLAVHGADSPAAPTLNLLHGSDVEGTTTGDGKHYKLTYGNDNTPNADVFGWYWGSADGAAFTSPAHKAWLVLPADANARSFFGLPDDDTTGIVNAEANSSLFTLHSSLSEWYTIDGMKLSGKPTAKGVYILNGRKIVIK